MIELNLAGIEGGSVQDFENAVQDFENAGICGCDDNNKYSLFTGQPLENPELRCGLKPYFVESSGNSLFISN